MAHLKPAPSPPPSPPLSSSNQTPADQQPQEEEQGQTHTDPFEDVFFADSHSIGPSDLDTERRARVPDASDLPRLRHTHITNGYREGVAASKATYVQEGFDEGHALGGELGLRVGAVSGVLEGIAAAIDGAGMKMVRRRGMGRKMDSDVEVAINEEASARSGSNVGDVVLNVRSEEEDEGSKSSLAQQPADRSEVAGQKQAELRRIMREAEQELSLQNVFGRDYVDEDGIWKWEVAPRLEEEAPDKHRQEAGTAVEKKHEGAEDSFTFRDVADSHPLIAKWRDIAQRLAHDWGLGPDVLRWHEDEDQKQD